VGRDDLSAADGTLRETDRAKGFTMSGGEQSVRAVAHRYTTAAMTLFPAVAVVPITVGSGLTAMLASEFVRLSPVATACVCIGVAAAGAGLTAILVWVLFGPNASGSGDVFHGPTRHPRMRDRVRVAHAAQSMSDAELEQTIRALADTEDQLLMDGHGEDAARVASDRTVCLAVRDRRRHARTS